MKIGILGAGRVGGTLGVRWANLGHDVVFASREPDSERLQLLAAEGGSNAGTCTYAEAVEFADTLVLAVPWSVVRELLDGLRGWDGKILIDATNRIRGPAAGESGSAPSHDVMRYAPGARVVRAFNTIGYEVMLNPVFGNDHATLLICGDDAQAKAAVMELSRELGFDPVDIGDLSKAEIVDHMAKLWIGLAYNTSMGREFAFKLLPREG